MNYKILHIASRTFLMLVALQILNLSVNSIDFRPIVTSNLTEFNDINTLAEYVSEIILGHVNAFPENAKKTQKQSQLQKHISLKIINQISYFELRDFVDTNLKFCSPIKENYLYEFYKEINPPPPKA